MAARTEVTNARADVEAGGIVSLVVHVKLVKPAIHAPTGGLTETPANSNTGSPAASTFQNS